jgi:hypothetical protein
LGSGFRAKPIWVETLKDAVLLEVAKPVSLRVQGNLLVHIVKLFAESCLT